MKTTLESNRTRFPSGVLSNPEAHSDLGDIIPENWWATVQKDYRHTFVPGFGKTIRTDLPAGTKVRLVRVGNPLNPSLFEAWFPPSHQF